MIIERKKNAISGTFFGLLLKVVQILASFIIRTIFIRFMGMEYLGLNSLFTAILQVLNMAELGVSSALIYSMYRPIAEDNEDQICRLMNLYRRYYRIIGLAILAAGLAITPFLRNFIKGEVPADVNLYILYFMHLAVTVLSYWLFAYRNSLFTAHQRNDILSIISLIVHVVFYTLQVVALLYFRNYYLYLTLSILMQIAINLVTAAVSKKHYPRYEPKGAVSEEERKDIGMRIRSLFVYKVGGVVNHSADTIVISALLGLEILAVYQNYYYIVSAIMTLFSTFFTACTAGVGNSLIVRSEEQNRKVLYNVNHVTFYALSVCCTCYVSFCQPFMKLWVGENLMLQFGYVLLFALYLFAEEVPRVLIVFRDGGGVWYHDRYRPLVAAGCNLVMNLILTRIIGLYGIIISTIISLLFIAFPWLVVNINKRLFPIGLKKYLFRIAMYFLVIALSISVTYFIDTFLPQHPSMAMILVRCMTGLLVSTVLFFLFFQRVDETKYLISNIKLLKNKILPGRT